jgi:hypothetical protein
MREVALVVIAGLIGFGGAWLGSHATIVTQRDQAREDRRAEARSKRASTYYTFTRAAGRFSIANLTMKDALRQVGKRRCFEGVRKPCRLLDVFEAKFPEWLRARSNFGEALDQVYIYGSARVSQQREDGRSRSRQP